MAPGLRHGERQTLGLRRGARTGLPQHHGGRLTTAYAVNAPVLALTGQIQQSMIRAAMSACWHELPDQLSIMRGLTRMGRPHHMRPPRRRR